MAIQKIPGLIFSALLFMSCVSYKTIPGLPSDQTKISSSIAIGSVLRVTLKNGEIIKKLKIKEIDSLKFSGIQRTVIKGEWVRLDKTLMVDDVSEIKKRQFSPGKTAGLILLSVSIPILLIGLLYSPSIN